jgi:hypothetical protein
MITSNANNQTLKETNMTTAANNFQALINRLNTEDRMFHMDDDITEFDMFTKEEQAEFGAIIEAASIELTVEEFDAIAYGFEDDVDVEDEE